jgi:transcriptional regulator with GAF, ATPase, and Fis domain
MLRFVVECLRKHKGNRAHAAKELGVTVRCLRYWIQKFDELAEFRRT